MAMATIHNGSDAALSSGLALEHAHFAVCVSTGDQCEGTAAFFGSPSCGAEHSHCDKNSYRMARDPASSKIGAPLRPEADPCGRTQDGKGGHGLSDVHLAAVARYLARVAVPAQPRLVSGFPKDVSPLVDLDIDVDLDTVKVSTGANLGKYGWPFIFGEGLANPGNPRRQVYAAAVGVTKLRRSRSRNRLISSAVIGMLR